MSKIGNAGTADGQFQSPAGIATDIQGNIYVADTVKKCIQKFNSNGQFLLKFGNKGTADGQFTTLKDLATDTQGNIYIPDYSKNRIQKFAANGQFLSAIVTGDIISTDNSIAVDGEGNLYMSVTNDVDWIPSVRKYSAIGQFLFEYVKFGLEEGQIESLSGIAVDAQGNVYLSDYINSSIQQISSTGQYLWKIAPSANGQFSSPTRVAVSEEGNVYVLDSRNHRVQILSSSGQFLFKFGTKGINDDQLLFPSDIEVDETGNIYVLDRSYVKKFSPKGEFITKFGSDESGGGYYYSAGEIAVGKNGEVYVLNGAFSLQTGLLKFSPEGQFLMKLNIYDIEEGQPLMPNDIALDQQGNVYISADEPLIEKSCVVKLSSDLQLLSKFAREGNEHYQLNFPDAIHIDNVGNIYLADNVNTLKDSRIRKFTADGQILSTSDIPSYFTGITVDTQENIYIVELDKHRLLKYSPGETVITNNYIRGTIYEDANKDCILNGEERRIAGAVVIAQPGPYYATTDSLGNYSIEVGTGTYTVEQILPEGSFLKQTCPPNNESHRVTFNAYNDTIRGNNFSRELTFLSLLSTSVSSNRRRRCFTNTTTISYQNSGNAIASDVKVHLQLPQHVVLVSANLPFMVDQNKHYVFTIGTLAGGVGGKISIVDSVVCDNPDIRDLTQCTKVWITPANNRTPLPDWDKSDITLKAKCADNGLVNLNLHNTGTGHMADSSSFRIYLDAQLAFQHKFKLQAGDSLSLQVPANGQTVRLEADQRHFHPTKTQTSITIEACGLSNAGKVSTGFVAQLPQDDEEPEVAIECLPIIDSFDPNDKLVLPMGVTENHYTPTNRALEYTVRFQNTGTDYAYKVVVVDTLSEHLDMNTFQMGAASHAYKLNISGKGRPILTFTFDNINLPDSTRDQLGSNGFVKFSIKPLAIIAEKTVIENYADIFFDFNEPVRTNTVYNSIYDVPAKPVNSEKVIICQPNAIAIAGTNRSFCGQDTLYLQANTPLAGKGKWKLIKGSATIQNLTNPTSSVTNLSYGETIFEWKVPVNTCATDSTSSTVVIVRKPIPSLPTITQKGADSLLCTVSGSSYEWYWNETKLAAAGQQIQVSESGKYTVKVTLEECSSPLSAAFSYQKVPTGLDEYVSQVKVYPNPATGVVFVELPEGWQAKITLLDGVGRVIQVNIHPGQERKREIRLAAIKHGLYMLHIETTQGVIVRKLMVR